MSGWPPVYIRVGRRPEPRITRWLRTPDSQVAAVGYIGCAALLIAAICGWFSS